MAGLRVTVVKPVKPLRYRLSPVEEKLDNLDKLEKEFEQAVKAGKIPEEQRLEYAFYLKVQRDKLQATKDKTLGIVPEVVKVVDTRVSDTLVLWECLKWLASVLPTQRNFKIALGLVVLTWFFTA